MNRGSREGGGKFFCCGQAGIVINSARDSYIVINFSSFLRIRVKGSP